MLKQHRNAFLDTINESGLDLGLFNAEEDKDSFVIEIKNSPMRFVVEPSINDFHRFRCNGTKFRPGFPMGWLWWRNLQPIDKTLTAFRRWLETVAKPYLLDQDLPDYWSQVELYKSVVSKSEVPSGEGEKFTEKEKEDLRNSVKSFRGMITEEFNPTPEQSEFINERLEYLSRAADRLNRFDWNGLAISVVVSIAVNLSADTERGRVLFALFKAAFQATTKLLQ